MAQVLITPDILNNISYDYLNMQPATTTAASAGGNSPKEPTLMIVFSNSDINAAIHYLVKSLEAPCQGNAIATLLVQESVKKVFIEKLQTLLKPYDKPDDVLVNSIKVAKKLNAQLIGIAEEEKFGPTLVCDFTHEQFGGDQPTGIVTLHTFRTSKEAISLVGKESLSFSYASIWHENHSYAYELVAALNIKTFFINCYHVAVTILAESAGLGKSYVAMDKSYHYETLPCGGMQKSVVFPFGSIFSN